MKVVKRLGVLVVFAGAVTAAQGAPSVYPTGVTIYDPARTWNGYTVLSPLATQAVIVIDMNGNVVKRWDDFNSSAGGPARVTPVLRKKFRGTYIVNGGFSADAANSAIAHGETDLVAFGVPFLANPDLPHRFATDAPLNAADPATFYQGEDKGYVDYPAAA